MSPLVAYDHVSKSKLHIKNGPTSVLYFASHKVENNDTFYIKLLLPRIPDFEKLIEEKNSEPDDHRRKQCSVVLIWPLKHFFVRF